MNIKIIVIVAIVYIYGITEYIINYFQKKKIKITHTNDLGSLWVIIVSISIGYALAFIIAATKTGRIYYWDLLFIIGLFIVAAGAVIRFLSIKQLNHYFSYSVARVSGQELFDKGFYSVIRHPGYLGQLIIFLGIAIMLSNWISVIAMMIPIIIGYMYRIKVEENFMIEQMGITYIEYKKKTKKLLPGLY